MSQSLMSEGESHSMELQKLLDYCACLRKVGACFLPGRQVDDLDNKMDRCRDLIDQWKRQPDSDTRSLRVETIRIECDLYEFLDITHYRLAVALGNRMPARQEPTETATIGYLKFSRFCLYYSPYLAKPQLKKRLRASRERFYQITISQFAGGDRQQLESQKWAFTFEFIFLLLPDLREHLEVLCDVAKLRNDLDDLSGYLQENWG